MQTGSLPVAPLTDRTRLYQSAYELLSSTFATPAESLRFVLELRPQTEDYAQVFSAEVVAIAQAHYDALYAVPRPLSRAPQQTELRLWLASSDELRERTLSANQFPGGYADIAHLLVPGIVWAHWKYVEPGNMSGMAYDGLAYIRDRWAFFPKPFRALSSMLAVASVDPVQASTTETTTDAAPGNSAANNATKAENVPQPEKTGDAATDGTQPPAGDNQVWQVWKE